MLHFSTPWLVFVLLVQNSSHLITSLTILCLIHHADDTVSLPVGNTVAYCILLDAVSQYFLDLRILPCHIHKFLHALNRLLEAPRQYLHLCMCFSMNTCEWVVMEANCCCSIGFMKATVGFHSAVWLSSNTTVALSGGLGCHSCSGHHRMLV